MLCRQTAKSKQLLTVPDLKAGQGSQVWASIHQPRGDNADLHGSGQSIKLVINVQEWWPLQYVQGPGV